VAELLRSTETSFLIVTSPEAEPAREASYLARKLAEADMPQGELIVNRVHSDGLLGHSVDEVAELLEDGLGAGLAQRVASNLADFDVLVRRDEAAIAELSRGRGKREAILVPYLDEDVQDLLSLAGIAEYLFA
jgi:anion-transporting  ArsA/GET3 family ATPase